MRDGAVIFVVCVVLIGCVGWLILRANGISPFAPATVVVQSTGEPPKEEPKPSPPEKKLVPVRAKTEIAAVVPVAEPHAVVAVSAPKPAVAPPPQMPYPSVPQIKPGFEKAHITQMYGDPSLRATTGSRGHTFDTFVYNRERGDAMTIIRFEDGRVYAARATP
jgi:hypothetical protein